MPIIYNISCADSSLAFVSKKPIYHSSINKNQNRAAEGNTSPTTPLLITFIIIFL